MRAKLHCGPKIISRGICDSYCLTHSGLLPSTCLQEAKKTYIQCNDFRLADWSIDIQQCRGIPPPDRYTGSELRGRKDRNDAECLFRNTEKFPLSGQTDRLLQVDLEKTERLCGVIILYVLCMGMMKSNMVLEINYFFLPVLLTIFEIAIVSEYSSLGCRGRIHCCHLPVSW